MLTSFVGDIRQFEKQLGNNCKREQLGRFPASRDLSRRGKMSRRERPLLVGNSAGVWRFLVVLSHPGAGITRLQICSQVQLIPNCFEKKVPFNKLLSDKK